MNLKELNWYRIDAICNKLFIIKEIKELEKALDYVKKNNLKILIIGDGSNILLNEDLKDYCVIKIDLKDIFYIEYADHYFVKVGAGYNFDDFVKYCLDLKTQKIMNLSGIPGNIGGTTFMNIHYKKYYLSDFIDTVEVFDLLTKDIKILNKSELHFTYTDNLFKKENRYIILNVSFNLEKIDSIQSKNIRNIILNNRNLRYPKSNTCGCFFYNLKNIKDIKPSIGYHIENSDIENKYEFTNVKLWSKHKNIFVTNNNCKSQDIIDLAFFIKNNINIEHKIYPEVRLIGFSDEIKDKMYEL